MKYLQITIQQTNILIDIQYLVWIKWNKIETKNNNNSNNTIMTSKRNDWIAKDNISKH